MHISIAVLGATVGLMFIITGGLVLNPLTLGCGFGALAVSTFAAGLASKAGQA